MPNEIIYLSASSGHWPGTPGTPGWHIRDSKGSVYGLWYDNSARVSGASSSLSGSFVLNSQTSSMTAGYASALTSGNKTVTGNLTVTGKITAEEFHTEYVSSSIIYKSGSTKSGNSNDDRHEFTGSIYANNIISASAFQGNGSQIYGVVTSSYAVSASHVPNPLTTLGDTLYHNGSGNTRLPGNTSVVKYYLTQMGTGTSSAAPVWEPFPTSTTNVFMLTDTSSSIVPYKELVSLSSYVSSSLATKTTPGVSTTPTLLCSFITKLGFPNATVIPAGLITAHYETQKNSGAQSYYTYFELYKRSIGGTETLLITSDNSTAASVNTIVQQTVAASLTNNISLELTDRIIIKIYAVMVSSTATISLLFDNNTSARLQLPVPSADSISFIPYHNATSNVNLTPYAITASAFVGPLIGTSSYATSASYANNATTATNVVGSYQYNFDYTFVDGRIVVYSAFDDLMDLVQITCYDDTALLAKINSII
jgi:hypothetical protein